MRHPRGSTRASCSSSTTLFTLAADVFAKCRPGAIATSERALRTSGFSTILGRSGTSTNRLAKTLGGAPASANRNRPSRRERGAREGVRKRVDAYATQGCVSPVSLPAAVASACCGFVDAGRGHVGRGNRSARGAVVPSRLPCGRQSGADSWSPASSRRDRVD